MTSWFKRLICGVLMLTINISAVGQAAAQIIRGPNGAPLTGYTANGTYVQNGQVVGNPHQQLHDLVNPTLWTTAAASFTNSTDPSFVQASLADIEAAIAVTPEPGGLALSRLYITVPPAVPLANPYTDPNAGAAGCNAATTCNQAVYNQLLLDAQASGYTATLDGSHIGKTHASTSPEIFERGFNLYQTKPVFVAAENPEGGATAFFALQGEQAKTHLAHLQQQNAALLGSAIFFSRQRIKGPGTGTSTDWEGNVIDPGAAFDAALGSAPSAPSQGQYSPTPSGNGNDFVVGYIKPDGQAHEFQLQHDQHFQQFQRQQNYGGWDGNTNASTGELDSLLGQNLRTAGTQHLKGEQAAASIDFRVFKEDRALFMQGMDLHRHVNKSDWALLDGLKNGQITPGHPDYERARALSQDAFRQAYAVHTEYNTRIKHSKESAAYQAQQLDLKDVDDKKLFEQGFDLYDRKADARGEQLLRDLQAGRLTPGTAAYQEARTLAEARFRVDYQGYLEPPKKRSWFQKLTDPATSLGKAMLWPKPQNVFDAMRAQPGQKQLDEIVLKNPTLYAIGKIAVTTVATIFTIGVGGAGAAATYDSYYTYAATGDMEAAHKVGLKSFATGVIAAGVTQGLGAGGMDWYTGSVIDAGSALQITQSIAVNTIAEGVAQTIVHGGSFADNMQTAFGNSLLTAGTAFAANLIGNTASLGPVGQEIGHAALGCAAGMVRSGSDGCAPGAVGAVAAHVAARWFDPAGGRTLSEDEKYFYSQTAGVVGGLAASAVGGGNNDAATNFAIGQSTGQNAVQNNFLRHEEQQRYADALNACKGNAQCEANATKEYQPLSDKNNKDLVEAEAACKKTGNCTTFNSLVKEGTPMGQGAKPTDYQSDPEFNGDALNAANQQHNDALTQELLDRPLSQEVRYWSSDDPLNSIPAHYQSEITAANQDTVIKEIGLQLAAYPVGEVISIAGNAAGRVVMQNGSKVIQWFESAGVKGVGANGGTGVPSGTPIPANSANAGVGLRNDLSIQAGVPTSTSNVWGASLDDLKQAFNTGGATITPGTARASSSGNSQIFNVESSSTGVVQVQYSPASTQSSHGGQYYKFTYADGAELKVIDPSTYRVLGWPENGGKITFQNPSGKVITYDPVSKTWR